jgi:hypothetical protein
VSFSVEKTKFATLHFNADQLAAIKSALEVRVSECMLHQRHMINDRAYWTDQLLVSRQALELVVQA